MTEGKRPGGLTALAVLNFVFAGWGLLSMAGMVVFFTLIGKIPTENMDEKARMQIEALQDMGLSTLVLIFTLTVVSCILLFLSGIGYLKQKKFLGRKLGSTYGILAIISSIVSGVMFDPELGGGFNIGTIIGLIYPVMTLILLNTTFKEDFIN